MQINPLCFFVARFGLCVVVVEGYVWLDQNKNYRCVHYVCVDNSAPYVL